MKDRILISVVIPSYNRANTVGETIESIVAQKVDADVEIVIGDDCSIDNAREVLTRYKEQHPDMIKLLFHEHNMGLGANWATCVKECKGKYICNCDSHLLTKIGIVMQKVVCAQRLLISGNLSSQRNTAKMAQVSVLSNVYARNMNGCSVYLLNYAHSNET